LSLRNSLYVLDARGQILASYAKAHLTPLGEYVPARALMERLGLARLAPGDLDFVPGPGPKTFALPGIPPFGAMICYEIIFGGRVTEYGQRPAWIVNISNDAWFGPTGPPQHLALARLRAIEEGLPIARATPTGVSAVIGPRGRVFGSLPQGRAGVLELTLPPPLPATPYARYGDALPMGAALLLMLGGWWAGRSQTERRRAFGI
jgi:apolipoprotein N-acyltransferase